MTRRARPEPLAADHLRELVQGFTTTEKVLEPVMRPLPTVGRPTKVNPWWEFAGRFEWRLHSVTHPALLDQIEQTVTGATTADDPVRGGRTGSKPAGRLDCLAYLNRINHQSRRLATDHGIDPDQPLRARLSALSGALGDRPHHTIKAWWATARVLTQHDSPPFAPNVPCPDCDMRGSLRVRFDPKVATCVECHGVWDDDEGRFGRLALWCEWAGEHLHGPRHLVPATDYDTDDVELGYLEVCGECEHERAAMAEREAARLRAPRPYASVPVEEAGRMAS